MKQKLTSRKSKSESPRRQLARVAVLHAQLWDESLRLGDLPESSHTHPLGEDLLRIRDENCPTCRHQREIAQQLAEQAEIRRHLESEIAHADVARSQNAGAGGGASSQQRAKRTHKEVLAAKERVVYRNPTLHEHNVTAKVAEDLQRRDKTLAVSTVRKHLKEK